MADRLAMRRILVDGMSCANCEQRIEKKVGALAGVNRVSASSSLGEVMVYYDPTLAEPPAMTEAIRAAGYEVRDEAQAVSVAKTRSPINGPAFTRFLGLIAVVAAIYFLLKYTVGFTFLPAVSQSMGYGLIFVVGLLTSLHCIAMCGGIVLSQVVRKEAADPSVAQGALVTAAPTPGAPGAPPPRLGHRIAPSLLYNAGRVVSYTVIGGIVGALGSLFTLTTALKGVMPIVAGAFMLFLGVRMLGIFPWLSRLKVRFPGIGGRKMRAAAAGRGPFIVGLFNGLMPCGPLQTMQVYALGTGSFLAGALSMFLFSLGTVPLLLGFGAISSLLSAKFNSRMVKASGVLVMALGLVMFSRGANLFGVALPRIEPGQSMGVAVATVSGGYQAVTTSVDSGQYHPLVVQKGIPVRWTVTAKADDLNGCNNPLTVPQYGIRKQLVPGDNLIEFTPDRTGTISYTCWMGMISSTIRVVDDVTKVSAADLAAPPAGTGSIASAFGSSGGTRGCCGVPPARFAGGRIPADTIFVASPGPQGQLETPMLDVTTDFTFQCGMGMLHGYVKVVDDVAAVDLGAVRREVAAFRTAAAAAGCCGRQQ